MAMATTVPQQAMKIFIFLSINLSVKIDSQLFAASNFLFIYYSIRAKSPNRDYPIEAYIYPTRKAFTIALNINSMVYKTVSCLKYNTVFGGILFERKFHQPFPQQAANPMNQETLFLSICNKLLRKRRSV